MKITWRGWINKENCHVFVNQFHGNFHSKSLSCREIKAVFRNVKWCFNASWGLKGWKNMNTPELWRSQVLGHWHQSESGSHNFPVCAIFATVLRGIFPALPLFCDLVNYSKKYQTVIILSVLVLKNILWTNFKLSHRIVTINSSSHIQISYNNDYSRTIPLL